MCTHVLKGSCAAAPGNMTGIAANVTRIPVTSIDDCYNLCESSKVDGKEWFLLTLF